MKHYLPTVDLTAFPFINRHCRQLNSRCSVAFVLTGITNLDVVICFSKHVAISYNLLVNDLARAFRSLA